MAEPKHAPKVEPVIGTAKYRAACTGCAWTATRTTDHQDLARLMAESHAYDGNHPEEATDGERTIVVTFTIDRGVTAKEAEEAVEAMVTQAPIEMGVLTYEGCEVHYG